MTDEQMYHHLSLMDCSTIETIKSMILQGDRLTDISQRTNVHLGFVNAVLEEIHKDAFDAACAAPPNNTNAEYLRGTFTN